MNPRPLLSIILPVFDDQENLTRILGDFSENHQDDSWEIIVVDDGSNKPLEVTERFLKNGQLIRNPVNQGAAAARNIGIEEARGEYVILLSVFLRIPADYIKKMKKFAVSEKFDFAQHLIVTDPTQEATHFQRFLGAHADRITSPSTNLSITNCQFAAAVITREKITSVGGFDDSMQHYGGHELDLIYRLDQAGYRQRVVISDLALQRVKQEDHAGIQKRLREYGSVGLPNLLKKHPELTPLILKKSTTWLLMSFFGISRWLEKRLGHQIESDKPLSLATYRAYLHLLMRNAWDAR